MSLSSSRKPQLKRTGEGASSHTHIPFVIPFSCPGPLTCVQLLRLELKGPPAVISVASQGGHSFPPPNSLRSPNPSPPKTSRL